jgi:hypothetical protein
MSSFTAFDCFDGTPAPQPTTVRPSGFVPSRHLAGPRPDPPRSRTWDGTRAAGGEARGTAAVVRSPNGTVADVVAADVAGLYDARILGMIVWFVPGVGAAMA